MEPLTAEDVADDLGQPSKQPDEPDQSAKEKGQDPSEIQKSSDAPLSIDEIYQSSKQSARENHWRNNPYAAGLVEPSWRDEINRNSEGVENAANGPNRSCCEDATEPEMDPTCGCLAVTGYVCGRFNVGRVGNMVILKESHVMVDEVAQDEEAQDGAVRTRKVSKRQIDLIVGPYWPMMVFVTYPLILAVSGWTALAAVFVPNYNIVVIIVWSAMTFGLCFSLFSVSFRDPGILPKYKEIPFSEDGNQPRSSWRWNDRAQSYAPRGSSYDPDCAVIVEEFDHTCPWTGTAVSYGNCCVNEHVHVHVHVLF